MVSKAPFSWSENCTVVMEDVRQVALRICSTSGSPASAWNTCRSFKLPPCTLWFSCSGTPAPTPLVLLLRSAVVSHHILPEWKLCVDSSSRWEALESRYLLSSFIPFSVPSSARHRTSGLHSWINICWWSLGSVETSMEFTFSVFLPWRVCFPPSCIRDLLEGVGVLRL